MAQRLRCPGGRPSVSYERIKCRCNIGYKIPIESNSTKTSKRHQPNHIAASQRVQGSREKVACSSNDQSRARRAKAESAHVDRPNGKAPLELRDG